VEPAREDAGLLLEVAQEGAARGRLGRLVVVAGLVAARGIADLCPARADELCGDVEVVVVVVVRVRVGVDDAELEVVGGRDGVADGERDLLADDEGAEVVARLEGPRLVVAVAGPEARCGEVGEVEDLLAREGVCLDDGPTEDELRGGRARLV